MTRERRPTTVLEKYLLPNPLWQEAYRAYQRMLGRPNGWLALIRDGGVQLVKLDRKGAALSIRAQFPADESSREFHAKYAEQLARDEERLQADFLFYKDRQGRRCVLYALRHLGRLKAILFLCGFQEPEHKVRPILLLFHHFLLTEVELAHKTFELNN